MVVTNFARNRVALLIGGSILNTGSQNYATYFMIGTGSSTVSPTQDSLLTALDRQAFTNTTYPSSQTLKFQGDWNSVELSGLTIQEFGVCGSEPTITGSMWSRSVFEGVTFDGTQEMRILEKISVL